MTQEQKAKAYDRALKYAMIYYTNGSENMKMMMKTCFPVLVEENEDEKIKKSLIHLVHLYGGEFGMIDANTSVEKAVSWIEKQDEQKSQRMISAEAKEAMYDKPTDLEVFINELSKQFPDVSFAKLSRIAMRVAKWAKPTDEEMKELLRTEYEKGRADTIAEMQKSTWSEEDEKRFKSCLNILQAKGLIGVTETINTKWLKSLKERVQLKQEWSEEDECYMTECINAIATKDGWSFEEKRKMKHWLKSLKERL